MNTQSNLRDFAAIATGAISIVGAAFGGLYLLFSSLTPAQSAAVVSLSCAAGFAIGAPALWLIARLTRPVQIPAPPAPTVLDYWPAQAIARPKTREVTIPTFTDNGERRPLIAEPKPRDTMLRTVTNGAELLVPAHLAARFAEQCATPSRSEWTGDRRIYGDCAKFYAEHGMLKKTSAGGYRWADGFDKAADRTRFVRQFYS